MSCDNPETRAQMKPIRLVGADEHVIGLIHVPTNVAIFPVRWHHFIEGCEAWSVDALTWRKVVRESSIAVTHWHLRIGSRRRGTFKDMIYRIAAEQFDSLAHSSDDCRHIENGVRERLHCPKRHFLYDAEREPPFEVEEPHRQGVLV